jgi:hypothetical protein
VSFLVSWFSGYLVREFAVVALLLGAASAVGAQSAPGAIRGVVTDSVGSPLAGASVRLAGTDTRRLSDASGRFLFDQVRAGRYLVTATRIGAAPARDSVVVRAGDTAQVSFALPVIPFVPETLPPRFARGARPDTAPAESETLDLVARVGKFPVLRARPPAGARRELRLWLGGGIAIPMTLIRLTIDGDRVRGQVINYLVQTVPDRGVAPEWRAFMDSVPDWLRHTFGCGDLATDTLHFPDAQAGYRNQLVAVCESRYSPEPDWRGLLRALEAHQVWTLPDESELPTIANIVSMDGGGMTVEAWNGSRYHTYSHDSSPAIETPEARDASAIQRALIDFLNRTSKDLSSARQ